MTRPPSLSLNVPPALVRTGSDNRGIESECQRKPPPCSLTPSTTGHKWRAAQSVTRCLGLLPHLLPHPLLHKQHERCFPRGSAHLFGPDPNITATGFLGPRERCDNVISFLDPTPTPHTPLGGGGAILTSHAVTHRRRTAQRHLHSYTSVRQSLSQSNTPQPTLGFEPATM